MQGLKLIENNSKNSKRFASIKPGTAFQFRPVGDGGGMVLPQNFVRKFLNSFEKFNNFVIFFTIFHLLTNEKIPIIIVCLQMNFDGFLWV